MKLNATLIILTFNEINGVRALYDKIPFERVDEFFVIDPGSNDGTLEFFRKKGIKVVIQKIKGRGEAFRLGVEKAKNDNIVFFSPDGNEDPDDILKLLNQLENGYDMAVASRFMKHARADDSTIPFPIRGWGNKFFTTIANILWGGKLTDSINGFRAIRRQKFLELNPDAQGFDIEYQLSIRALKLKYKIKEIPTIEKPRIGGKSTAYTFPTGWLFLKIILKELKIGKNFQDKDQPESCGL